MPEDRLSAVPRLSDSAGLLPGGEHRSHVVWGAAGGVPLQAQRPHRPQLPTNRPSKSSESSTSLRATRIADQQEAYGYDFRE